MLVFRRREWSSLADVSALVKSRSQWIVALLVAVACAPLGSRNQTEPPTDLAPYLALSPYPRGLAADSRAERGRIAVANREAAIHTIEAESQWYSHESIPGFSSPWPQGLPRMCVALSGGGLRSAAVSIGVLQGLAQKQREGQFPPIDVLSGVSGGAYAMYWLYGEGLLDGLPFDDVLLGPRSSGQDAASGTSTKVTWLDEHATTVQPDRKRRTIQYFDALAYLTNRNAAARLANPRVPPANGDYFAPDGPLDAYYGWELEAVFNHSSHDLHHQFHDWGSVTLTQLRRALTSAASPAQRYPVPIIGAAVRFGDNGCSRASWEAERASALPWRYFEFTPFRLGSYLTGYREPLAETLRGAVSASAAAMDSAVADNCRSHQFMGIRLGLSNPHFTESEDAQVNPPALKQGDVWLKHGTRNSSLTVADGGFSDNLAVFPLIQRHCQSIVAVDAGHDPFLIFDDFQYLQESLRRFHGIGLEVARIRAIAAQTNAPLPGSDSRSAPIAPRESCKPRNPECLYGDTLPNPVFVGKVSGLSAPIPFATAADDGGVQDADVSENFVLIKLSLDGLRNPVDYGSAVAETYVGQKSGTPVCSGTGLSARCYFPETPTTDQMFVGREFAAYRELGRSYVRLFWHDLEDGLTQPRQPAAGTH